MPACRRSRSAVPSSSCFSPRLPLRPLALAVFALGALPAWSQTTAETAEPAAEAAEAPAARRSAQKSLDAVTVQGARESATTRLPLTARETPQSVTSVTREQIERQSLTSIDAVLRNVNGVAVSFYDTQRPLYFARGFQITDFQIDGLPSYSSTTNQEFDTALYERIDVVRGANGILTGVGTPSATVSLTRKRPQRQFAGSVSLSAGSWDFKRAELDLNVPLNADGSVRSRFVIAPQKKDSFRDRYSEDKNAMLAVVEADLGSSTVASIGYQRQKNDPKAPIWGTIPRFATDGGKIDLPVSTSFSPSWTRWSRESETLYANLEHQFNDDWSLRASIARTEGETFSLRTYGYGRTTLSAPFINRLTGAGITLYGAVGGGTETQNAIDTYLSGKLHIGGRTHDVVLGIADYHTVTRTDGYTSLSGWRYDIPNIYAWNGYAPQPYYRKTGAWNEQTTDQTGLYASGRWRLTDALSLMTGVRLTNWERATSSFNTAGQYVSTTGVQKVERKSTPFVGLMYDVTPDASIYASYGRIFNPQNYRDANNNPLAPVTGSNAELGIKGNLLDGRLTGSFAIYETKQDNFGVRDTSVPAGTLPDGSSAYRAVDGTRSYGFEAELAGFVTPRWRVSAGLTRTKVERNASDLIYANFPEYLLQLSTDYQLSGALAPLSVGGGLQWQTKIEGFNIPHPILGTVTVTDPPVAVLNLRATWKFNERLSATLNINNATNKKYWANLDYANYADPRNIMLTLRAKF
ncbi:TonB-dependent siderophore receptor [Pseudacidovorax intermedius]|uniref:TonB-dependent siderophore receptor n=1 Tax=Pseudacidovorax intermedius TaxID=433924 RepID=UPI0026E9884B|nr:TonB-dependent siderophore receptor [Pseudacidovorax intermedius]